MKRLKDKGFSLLEVLVALAIFGILLGGFLAMMQQGKYLIRNSAETLHARLLANETMETLKARSFETLESYSFTRASELENMTVNVHVSDFGSNTLKKIVVTVQWTNPQGHEKNVVLSTLRSKYPFTTEGSVQSSVEGGGGQ